MALPSSFAMLALSPSIRENAAFLFLQTGANGLVDMFIQSATGSPVNIMQINSGVNVPNTVYVNELGSDTTGLRGSLTRPFATIDRAVAAASFGDTIEVFPGTYYVTGNMFKDLTSYYFHKGSAVELNNSGKLEVSSPIFGFDILGYFYLSANGVVPNPVAIYGNNAYIEYDQLNLGTGYLLVSGTDAGVKFKGLSQDSSVSAGKVLIDTAASCTFENSSFFANEVNIKNTLPSYSTTKWIDCTFTSSNQANQTCPYLFSGKYELNNCYFNGSYGRFISTSGQYSEVKNTKIEGGVIVSGSNYFENVCFNTVNFSYYPRFSIISNLGGHNVFTNCYARNFNNTSYLTGTYIQSGTASGSANFNIGNAFTSFKPTGAGTTINFGSFIFNTGVR